MSPISVFFFLKSSLCRFYHLEKKIIFPFRELFIQAGVLNLRNLGAIERRIARTVEHPKYQPPFVYYDVSLAVLDEVRCKVTIYD